MSAGGSAAAADAQMSVQQAQIRQAARYQWLAEKDSGSVQNAQQYTSQLRQQEAAVTCA